jgi:glutamate:GABA antiporter
MTNPEQPHLRKAMGLGDLILFYVVTGISLRWVAAAAAAGPSSVIIWLGAWIGFFIPLALAVVELTSRFPGEGGLYRWSQRCFGDFAGFMTGWTYWASNLPYFPAVLYFTASNALFLFPEGSAARRLDGDPTYFIAFATAAMLVATGLNLVGLQIGKWLHNLGAIGSWLPAGILLLVAGIAYTRFGSATHFTPASLTPKTGLRDMVFWAGLVFAFGGPESASFLGDEIRDVRRTLPRALLVSGILVTIGYVLGTIAILVALPSGEVSGLAGFMQAVERSAERIGWHGIGPFASLLVTIGNLGAVGAWLTATARLPFVAGLDRYLPEAFAKIHPKWGTPYVALLTQAGLAVVFIFLGQAGTTVKGAYDVLVSMGIIAYEIPYLFVFAALIRSQSMLVGPEVWRIPGGRPVAIVLAVMGFIVTSLAIVLSLVPTPGETNSALAVLKIIGLTAILLLAGVGFFVTGRRRARSARVGERAA